jgi:hypothetical protein
LGTWGRGSSTRNFENTLKEGSGYGASLSMGALLGEPGGGGSFAGGPEGHERKALGMGTSLIGAQLGNLEWATRDLEIRLKVALKVERLPV